MINLKETLTEYAAAKKYKIEELDGGKLGIDIGMELKDGSFRYQFVWVWVVFIKTLLSVSFGKISPESSEVVKQLIQNICKTTTGAIS